MMITEPMTLLTDYAIALEAFIFTVSLWHIAQIKQQTSIRLWAAAFGFVAIAALLGGTCHGFVAILGNQTTRKLWQVMTLTIGFASFFMVSATAINTLSRRWHRWLLIAAGSKLLVYFSSVLVHRSFGYVLADYLSAMLIVLALHLRGDRPIPGSGWIIAGILVSGLAAAIQAIGLQMKLDLNGIFNHNDFYHLIQMGGLYLLYRGAKRLKNG